MRHPFAKKLVEPLSQYFKIVQVFIDPMELGYPVRRPRSYCAGVNLKTMVWMGPEQETIDSDFKEMCGRSLEASGNIFFEAPIEMIDAENRRLAANRGFHHPKPEDQEGIFLTQVAPEQAMPPSFLDHWLAVQEDKNFSDGAFLADVENSVESHSCVWGTSVRTCVWNPNRFRHERLVSGQV